MGRTLHFTAKRTDGKNFTEKDIGVMVLVSEKMNEEPIGNLWTCESFYLDPLNYYPNWEYWRKEERKDNPDWIWATIKLRIKTEQKENKTHKQIMLGLAKDKWIAFHAENFLREAHGFCKTQGNELNSLMVFEALIKISQLDKDLEIELCDEGKFLYSGIKIKQGKCLPLLGETLDSIQHWARVGFWAGDKAKEITPYLSGIDADLIQKITKEGYDKYAKAQLIDLLGELKIIQDNLKKRWPEDRQFLPYNITNLPFEYWLNPDEVHRPVNPNDYVKYAGGAAKLMDGFEGEGFGLADPKAAETKAFEFTQQMFSVFGKNVEILHPIKKG